MLGAREHVQRGLPGESQHLLQDGSVGSQCRRREPHASLAAYESAREQQRAGEASEAPSECDPAHAEGR